MAQVQFQPNVFFSPDLECLEEEGAFIRRRVPLGHGVSTIAKEDAIFEGVLTPRATAIEEFPLIGERAFTLAPDRTHMIYQSRRPGSPAEGLYRDLEPHQELPNLVSVRPPSYPFAGSGQSSTNGLAFHCVSPSTESYRVERCPVCGHESATYSGGERRRRRVDGLVMFFASALLGTTYPLLGLLTGLVDALDE